MLGEVSEVELDGAGEVDEVDEEVKEATLFSTRYNLQLVRPSGREILGVHVVSTPL